MMRMRTQSMGASQRIIAIPGKCRALSCKTEPELGDQADEEQFCSKDCDRNVLEQKI